MSTQSSSTIKLNLPSGILKNAQGEAKRIGISIQDFIRMLLANHFASTMPHHPVSQAQSLYDQATQDIKNGNYTDVSSHEDLRKYLKKLNETA